MSWASACEQNEVAKDFFVSTYQSPVCLAIIQKNDTEIAKEVFAEYCPDWADEKFREAENVNVETRISGALNTIMIIYNVPEEIQKRKIEKALAMDYRSMGNRNFKEFKDYVEQINNE